MYQVSEEYLKQTKRKVQTFRLTGTVNKIAFTNHDILSGSFTITNQCSEQNDVKIGSVYIGELKCTFKPDLQVPDWTNAQIIVSEGLLIDGTAWEDVPLGVYTVSEANDTEYGVDITAYDNMARFNRSCSVDITIGTPYELLTLACTTCEAELGMTQAEVDALPNGTESLSLYTENDIETWQDFVFWVAQATGTIATMDREGKLVLRSYTQNVVDTLTNHNRFTGSKFSKFETRYSGLSCVNMADDTTSYYGSDPDNYLTYNLGSNPFLQYGVDSYKEQIRRAVLTALLQIDYVPFETSCLCGAMYDLGDIIRCTDGIAPGKLGCVMMYDYTFNGGYKITGFGSDPALATAKSKTDKNLEGLRNNVSTNEILFFNYENASAIQIGDGESKAIIDIRFTSSVSIGVLFQAEILLEATATEADVIGTIEYTLNEVTIIGYNPTETWKNGKHILSLMYMLMIEENSINRWLVKLNITGGSIAIAQGAVRAVIYGQGLVGTVEWDGFITLEEKLTQIALKDAIEVSKALTCTVIAGLIDVERNVVEEQLQTIQVLNQISVGNLLEKTEIRWGIASWTFTTESECTYSSRYVTIDENMFKLASTFVNKSTNESIDRGMMNVVKLDSTEFESIQSAIVSDVLNSVSENGDTEQVVKYLLWSEDKYYTIQDNVVSEIILSGDTLRAADFETHGLDTAPASDYILQLESPKIYKWTTATDTIQDTMITIKAVPHPQIIQATCDMSDVSIYGITGATAIHEGINVKLSYDAGMTWTEEEILTDALEGSMLQAYESVGQSKILTIAFIVSTVTDSLTEFQYQFKNEEE
ncbi:hypothetical protein LKD28_11020 [Coprococcus sp. CLA-AA-H212]|jgi:hypothetical protein|uniref:Uncharacterized protein n=1 Tax=Coprococcus hominis (ex Arizal et al. 2022) TaxID=2881262 RepID=A0ABS8FQR6_9FIRM|nr:hypothetical protein [Coprococcus hominis (ex Arizal et al. 2022)]MCC2219556.1 hypothetical protein [Coprococcus hominis (ex Arizal et al. 2022)]